MKTKVIASHTSRQRDSWWYLVQNDDGTLHVGHESDSQGERVEREVQLNDFMREGILIGCSAVPKGPKDEKRRRLAFAQISPGDVTLLDHRTGDGARHLARLDKELSGIVSALTGETPPHFRHQPYGLFVTWAAVPTH